jgi:hypothetical protein
MSFLKNSFAAKAICAALLLANVLVAAPRKADAGIILWAAAPIGGMGGAAAVGGMFLGIGTLATGFGLGSVVKGSNRDTRAVIMAMGLALMILDDSSAPASQLEAELAERYRFIEDRAVVADLAQAILAKVDAAPAAQDGTRVTQLSRAEIVEILAPTDVMENHADQFEAMVAELQ